MKLHLATPSHRAPGPTRLNIDSVWPSGTVTSSRSEIAQMAAYTAGYVRKVLNAGAAPSEPWPGGLGVGGPRRRGCSLRLSPGAVDGRAGQANYAGCRSPRRVLARRRWRAAYAGSVLRPVVRLLTPAGYLRLYLYSQIVYATVLVGFYVLSAGRARIIRVEFKSRLLKRASTPPLDKILDYATQQPR